MDDIAGRTWQGYRWTAWMPLMAAHPLALAQLPSGAGLYRIRYAGQTDRLLWVGWTDSGVRLVVERLSRQVHLPVEPFDDPATPAHRLWLLCRQNGVRLEVSGVQVPLPAGEGENLARELRRTGGLE